MTRAGSALAVLCAAGAVLLGGCASFGAPGAYGSAGPPAAQAGSLGTGGPVSAAEAAPAPLQIEIDAPSRLRRLLQQHLDVVRLAELARGENVDDSEIDRLVLATPLQARELLQTEGYFEPRVDVRRDGGVLRVEVEPGPQAVVGRVTVEVQGALQEQAGDGDADARRTIERWAGGWQLPADAPFRNPAWSDAKADALARLRAAGYATATWAGTAAELDPETRLVRLFVVADSGPLFRAGALDIEGLKHHDAATVRNIAGIRPGTPLTENLLLDFQERLRQSGLFDGATVGFDPDPARADAAPVRVRLTEAPRQVWTLGVGVSDTAGLRASVEHLHRRPFGWAAIARNKIEWGRLRRDWQGEISTHPLEQQYRWLIGGALDRLNGDTDIVESRRLRLGRAQNLARRDRFVFVEAESSSRRVTSPASTDVDSREQAVSLNAHAVWRRLDDLLLPTRGASLSLQLGVGGARGTPGEAGPFGRVYARLTGYRPLPGGWFGQARLEAGQVVRRSAVPVPDSIQFRAGGDESVRGYAWRSLGPIVGGVVDSGDALLTASLEVARPILEDLPALWGAAFIDAGQAAASFRELRPVVGVGVGVRFRSPIGPLKLDLAWGHETQKLRLHFSVGVTF